MKKIILSAMLSMAAWMGANAMSFERAQAEALYLTDKMAYELNLNDQQYNDAYEINLDYFLSIDSPSDLQGVYYHHRLNDLRCILHDWQYSLMMAADYFIRPVYWRSGGWYFSVYSHYRPGYFYYSYPTVYYNYRGGHGRSFYNHGFYANRRPAWNGGLRGHYRGGVGPERTGRGNIVHERGGRINGNGYHINMPDRGRGNGRDNAILPNGNHERTDRGNSFGNSSSRNPRNDFLRRGSDNSSRMERGNSDMGRGFTTPKSTESGRGYGTSGSRGSSSSYSTPRSSTGSRGFQSTPRSSGSSSGFSGSRGSGFSSPRSSGHSSGFSGGSRGGNGGGGVSRGRR